MLRSCARAAAVVVAGLTSAGSALAQAPTRLGAEFQVNTVTANNQLDTADSLDLETNGDFVLVWSSYLQDGSSNGVFGQRFASSGAELGGEFVANTHTLGSQHYPAVGVDADGDFVVVWQSDDGQDGSAAGVFARRFDSSGVPLATEFQVNIRTTGDQSRPVVARDADGDFVVAWQSTGQDGSLDGVFARRFNAAGTAQASELQVNAYTNLGQINPAIELDPDGDFVLAWQSLVQDGNGYGVFVQRFNSLGVRQGLELQVNDYITDSQAAPAVGVDADGDFVIAWQSFGQDGNGDGVFARRFASTGTRLGAEMHVNLRVTSAQNSPSIGVDADGDFVIAWQSSGQDGSGYGVFLRHFKSSGVPTSGDLQVNTTVAGAQSVPAIRSDADGDFVAAWQSAAQDGDDAGLFAQRFDVPALLDIDGNGQLTALTDGLLLLRFLFGFTGSTLTSGAVGPSCTRCDGSTIGPHLQSLQHGSFTPPAPVGTEFQINTVTADTQSASRHSIGADATGDFVVVWLSFDQDGDFTGIFGRRFASSGAKLGVEFQVNAYTVGAQQSPSIGVGPGGDFVVAWASAAQDGSSYGVFARRFASSGTALASEFQVNVVTASTQLSPVVARGPNGDFVVVFTSIDQDGENSGVFARRFGATGIALGAELQVNTYTPMNQGGPSLDIGQDGDFVVTWQSLGDGSGYGVFGQRFTSLGAHLGPQFQVNSHFTNTQTAADVAIDPDGDFVVVWESLDQGNGDIFARRFDSTGTPQGVEMRVNVNADSDQSDPSIDIDDAGNAVVAWDGGGAYSGIVARHFNPSGIPTGGDILVKATTSGGAENSPSLASDADGDFVLAWSHNDLTGPPNLDVFGQRFAVFSLLDIDGDGQLTPLTDGLLALRFLFGFTGSTLTSGAVGAGCTRCDSAAILPYLQSLI